MSGSRAKALRRAFRREHDRAPEGARVKKTMSMPRGLLRSFNIFAIETVQPSEWRREKKHWKRSRRNP